MDTPVLMVAETVPTSARNIDKLATVGMCSGSRDNEATRTSDERVIEPHIMEVPKQLQQRKDIFVGRQTINVWYLSLPEDAEHLCKRTSF